MVRENNSVNPSSEKVKKFMRFQISAMIATAVDFLITKFLKENFKLHYTLAVAGGATAGAFTAFSLNRYWVFNSINRNPVGQGVRYLLVACGSIVLNTTGTYLLTDYLHLPYLISKAIIALVIGFTYSYYFSKRFVFYA